MLIDKPGLFATFRLNAFIAFILGVAVGLGIASYAYNGAARPAVQAHTTPPAAAPLAVAPPAMTVASSGVDTKLESVAAIDQRQSHPAPKENSLSKTASVDTTLFEPVDAGRAETISADLPTELVAEARPLEAASAASFHIDSAQESDMRSESEKDVPQKPATADASLLPHERLQ